MSKQWYFFPHDRDAIRALERRAGIPAVLAQLLLCRGLSNPEDVRDFLDPQLTQLRDPDQLPGVSLAAGLIHRAVTDGEHIVVYGDYDADGMCATAILYRCLTLLGANVSYHVPNRLSDGYGLNGGALQKLASQGAQVVITVDCGIANVSEARLARELGLQLIVTDHHEMTDTLPEAAAIVHPRLPGHDYPFAGLCGAAVAFKLAWALCQRASGAEKVNPRQRSFLLSAVGLVALATVADVVPLLDENRVLVKHGLDCLRHRAPQGIKCLLLETGLAKKPSLESEDIAFTLAPRLNASGRLGEAALGVELLVTDSEERAKALAQHLQELNQRRDGLERSVYLAAQKQVTEFFDPEADPALVLAARGWHVGVIGIVSGRLADKFHRPVVVISQDELGVQPGVGSGRGAGVLHLSEAFAHCTEHLVGHGGHAAAAGLQIEDSKLDAFRTAFCEYAAEHISEDDRVATVQVDTETPLSSLTLSAVSQIERLAPFGQANDRPILCASGVSLAGTPRRMGGGDRHLNVKLKQHQTTLRAVAFGHGDWADSLSQVDGQLDIVFRPVINSFAGRRSVELHLVDWRRSKIAASLS
ncbi:MAG: single-stranded-DNA-specific exonuclease RecJ [Pirellulaceae bacterium]|nr:single-stranded-DNA-specific exonuclease RecJ [Pirellulaceae bacterium]